MTVRPSNQHKQYYTPCATRPSVQHKQYYTSCATRSQLTVLGLGFVPSDGDSIETAPVWVLWLSQDHTVTNSILSDINSAVTNKITTRLS
jgi:hypothetical protein